MECSLFVVLVVVVVVVDDDVVVAVVVVVVVGYKFCLCACVANNIPPFQGLISYIKSGFLQDI